MMNEDKPFLIHHSASIIHHFQLTVFSENV
jgi:hypothetical protein